MTEPGVLVGGIDFGEGLRWHEGRLWYSDFFRRGVFAVTPDGEQDQMLALDDAPSGTGWMPDGRLLVVSMHERRILRQEADGSLVVHSDFARFAGGSGNDMVVAADGQAYVGNFGYDVYAGEPFALAALVRVGSDGKANVAAEDLAFPNGSVITADGRTLIVGESGGHRYTAFTIASDGTLHDRRVWAELGGISPDGCTLDAETAIWTANPSAGNGRGPGEVVRIREGGEITHRITVPQTAYACALGGDDGCTLFVTTAPGAMPNEVAGKGLGAIYTVRVEVPHAGLP